MEGGRREYAIGVFFGFQVNGRRAGVFVAHGALGEKREATLP